MESADLPERNATFKRFGGDGSLIADYRCWSVQVRPRQATLGALIVLAHGPTEAFGDLPDAAHCELGPISRDIQAALGGFGPARLNYLMLMMVDPHVHFHVLPRYPGPVKLDGIVFDDPGWPGPPDLGHAPDAPEAAAAAVHRALAAVWPARPAR